MSASRQSIKHGLSNPNLWLLVLLLLGGLLRLYDITDEPLELHPARQFRALIIARSIYFQTADDIPNAQVEFADTQAGRVGLIEPSILEYITAQLYRLSGQELTWLGKLVPISAWMLGGLAVFALGAQIGSTQAAFISLTYYIFLPFGVSHSRLLMADPIMTAGTALSLWALYIWAQKREMKYALLAGMVTGITILFKSVAGIILIVPFALFLLGSFRFKELVKDRQVWVILLLAAAPTAAYYYYGIVVDGRLTTQFKGRFFPEVWSDIVFYKSWGLRIIREFNPLAFGAGLASILLTKRKPVRWMLFGWWAGYFLYGMLFAYYTWTHSYYHLPMVPLAAVSLAPSLAHFENLVRRRIRRNSVLSAFAVICLTIVGFGTVDTVRFLSAEDYRINRSELEQLGAELDQLPPGKIVGLTGDYETSFSFYSFTNVEHWPTTGDVNFQELQGNDAQSFLQLWNELGSSGYFFVTDEKQLDKQPLLKQQLSTCLLLKDAATFTLYSICPYAP